MSAGDQGGALPGVPAAAIVFPLRRSCCCMFLGASKHSGAVRLLRSSRRVLASRRERDEGTVRAACGPVRWPELMSGTRRSQEMDENAHESSARPRPLFSRECAWFLV